MAFSKVFIAAIISIFMFTLPTRGQAAMEYGQPIAILGDENGVSEASKKLGETIIGDLGVIHLVVGTDFADPRKTNEKYTAVLYENDANLCKFDTKVNPRNTVNSLSMCKSLKVGKAYKICLDKRCTRKFSVLNDIIVDGAKNVYTDNMSSCDKVYIGNNAKTFPVIKASVENGKVNTEHFKNLSFDVNYHTICEVKDQTTQSSSLKYSKSFQAGGKTRMGNSAFFFARMVTNDGSGKFHLPYNMELALLIHMASGSMAKLEIKGNYGTTTQQVGNGPYMLSIIEKNGEIRFSKIFIPDSAAGTVKGKDGQDYSRSILIGGNVSPPANSKAPKVNSAPSTSGKPAKPSKVGKPSKPGKAGKAGNKKGQASIANFEAVSGDIQPTPQEVDAQEQYFGGQQTVLYGNAQPIYQIPQPIYQNPKPIYQNPNPNYQNVYHMNGQNQRPNQYSNQRHTAYQDSQSGSNDSVDTTVTTETNIYRQNDIQNQEEFVSAAPKVVFSMTLLSILIAIFA